MLAGQARAALGRAFFQNATPELAPSRRAFAATTHTCFSWFGKPEPAPAVRGPITNKTEIMQFNAAFPDVVRDLTETGRHLEVPAATKWFAQVLQYTVPGGKRNRGLAVVQAYKYLAQENTAEGLRQAQLMGWAVEMLHASLSVAQDALDGAELRRGRASWPVHCGLGLRAVNDAALLETGLYELLKRHFRTHPLYVEILELFHDVTHKSIMGQVLDIQARSDATLELFTMERYQAIVKYKTAYYTFQLPVILAMYLAENNDSELHRQAKTILMEMGQIFQVQTDFLDCFGDPSTIGHESSDIETGRCSWLAVVALQRANPAQKKLMQECYGSRDQNKVERVRKLYRELAIPATYRIYEEQSYELLCRQIQQVSKGLPHKLFFRILESTYVRQN
ncbi:farnesyl pyrophosphate synthase-like [Neocloeon triangulifer]|uniref:farnesyl pyrophosphate synthase-like n=1 Tax=Neocloeon triangulifer TaxID=2078957 RepID=UPI00286F0E7B|nr:farnesyl pyrophosphate synthase-like [Neocloeon triangulifer]